MEDNKGFTLVELLVVIAIIGILASIVFVTVSKAKLKTKDVAIRQSMKLFNILAQDYYEKHNENYAGFCNDSATEKIFGSLSSPKKFKYCHHDDNTWAICAQLNIPEDLSKAWCVDSTGNIKEINQIDCVSSITFCP